MSDPQTAMAMSEYVHWSVLFFHRSFDAVLRAQKVMEWRLPSRIPASSRTYVIRRRMSKRW